MNNRTATIDDLLSWGPCGDYTESDLRELASARKEWTALDVLALSNVSAMDRLWVVLRPELVSARTARLFACACAERAFLRERDAGREPDERSWNAVSVARRHAESEATDKELSAARAAAWDAARDAAAWAAAWDAEAKWQIEALIALLQKENS